MGEGEGCQDVVAKLEGGLVIGEEGQDPAAEGVREAHVPEDLGDMCGVDVVEEAQDVEQEEGPSVA